MLCPEVWNLESALKNTHVQQKSSNEILEYCEDVISNHHLNHHVSVLISDCEYIPEDLSNILKTDCEYYRVRLPLASLIDKEFLDLFILAGGEVSGLSIGTRLDADECSAALLPSGHLVLSVGGDLFRSLGIEGKATSPDRYGIVIDLKKPYFVPGKSNYDRTLRSLSKFNPVDFDFIVAWEPHDEKICPSTIGKYFADKGYRVQQCQPNFEYRVDTAVSIPVLKETPQAELLEWLGAHSLGVFRKDSSITSPETAEYLSSYGAPTDGTQSKKTILFQWTGFFTRKRILQLFEKMRLYFSEKLKDDSWISLTVQGFMDSPVAWKCQPHGLYRNCDEQYTIFIGKENLQCMAVVPSNGKIR